MINLSGSFLLTFSYKKDIDEMPHFIVEAENYIEATFKAQKKYPSDKYTHMLIDTDVEKMCIRDRIRSENCSMHWKKTVNICGRPTAGCHSVRHSGLRT